MDPFWSNVFEYFRDRRLGAVFFRTLLILIALLVLGVIFYPLSLAALPVGGLLFLFWAGRAILRARARWRDRYQSAPMSRDEIKKARSKLLRAKN